MKSLVFAVLGGLVALGAAGAWIDSKTVERGASLGVDARISLAENDSGSFFAKIGQQIVTGPTHTNVMDVGIVLNRHPRPN